MSQPLLRRPRRSWLYVPADDERKLEKAASIPADVVILDLEDAVAPDRKAAARKLVHDHLSHDWPLEQLRYVRINAVTSQVAWREDIESTIAAGPDGYVIPKVQGESDVVAVDVHLDGYGAAVAAAVELTAIVTETALGFAHSATAMAGSCRVTDVHWGAEDLSASIGARATHRGDRYLPVFEYVRSSVLIKAKAAGRRAIDAPYLVIGDNEALAEEASEAALMGFDGKQAIHPGQVEVINRAFTPTEDEVARAESLLECQATTGAATFLHDGAMVDAPHLARARQLLALAAAIEGKETHGD